MSLVRDVRSGFRSLIQNPGFAAAAVAMLALGIGVNATVFNVTDAVLFKGFHLVSRNDRMAYIHYGGCCVSYPDFEDYRAEAKSFQGMAIVHGVARVITDKSGFPERYDVTEVSADTFSVVGQRPIRGRDFTHSDEIPGAPPVAILNYGFWERRYGKDPAVLGRTVRMNGVLTAVIGVMPQGFDFPQKVEVWVPLVTTEEVRKRENRQTWFVLGRLKDGVSFEEARVEIQTIGKRLASAYPSNRDLRPSVDHFHEFMIGPNATALYGSMWGAVGFVLLIACANLANLLLARGMGRSREIAVRIALGASRWRIVRQLLVESLMLSFVGGIGGWWIAKWGSVAYQRAMFQKSSWLVLDYAMDQRVLTYLIAISIGTGLLFGLAPAVRLSKLDINTALKDGGRGATAGRRLSMLLVTGEMAMAIVLLAGAGVLIRSFLKIHSANMGVNTANVLVGTQWGELPATRYARADARVAFYDQIRSRVRSTPGVESAALAWSLPTWGGRHYPFEWSGAAPVDENRRPIILTLAVSPSYFQTLGAAVLAGRDFSDADRLTAPPVAIVNQQFANTYWRGQDALSKRLRLFDDKGPGAWLTVVGIASNIIQGDTNRQRFDPIVYLPFSQMPIGPLWVFARTRGSKASLAAAFRSEIQAVDPDVPVFGPFTLAERLEMFWDNRFYGAVFLVFAAIALLLASIGLYTLTANSVRQGTQEIGVRMALGATARDILQLVFEQSMLPLGIGLGIGLAASLAVNRLLRAELVEVSPSDPITLSIASVALVLSAILGCLIPARRAMRVDPAVALRHE